MRGDGGEVLLCCLLWAKDGDVAGLREYEDRVLALVAVHGGQVVERAQSEGRDGHPAEIQFLRFRSQMLLDSYLADPRRATLAAERDLVISRTELFPIRLHQ